MVAGDGFSYLQRGLVMVHRESATIRVHKQYPAFLQCGLAHFQRGLIVIGDQSLAHLQHVGVLFFVHFISPFEFAIRSRTAV